MECYQIITNKIMEGKPPEDTDEETMVLIIKLELEYENEPSFIEPVSSVEGLDNDENFRNERNPHRHKGNSVTLDCELNNCYSEHTDVDGAHESYLQRESRSTNELLTKANGSKRNRIVDRNEFPLVSTSRFIKAEKFSPIVNQKINMNVNGNISCSICQKIFPNESSLLLHMDKEHPDIKCGPMVMFVDEVNQDDRIFDFIPKSRIKKEKLEQKLRTIQEHKKADSSGNKTIKIECSDSEDHPKVMFVDEVNQDDRIFDFVNKSRIKKQKFKQKLMTIQNHHRKAGNKTIKIECSDSDGHKVFLVERSVKKEVDDVHPKLRPSKPHHCNTCGTIFTTMSQLMSHKQKVHKNEKPEVCKLCGKGFKARKTLIIHERLHTGETPYQCQFCEKAFVQKSSLNSHFKTDHKDVNIDSQVMPKVNLKRKKAALVLDRKPYICDGCQRPFTFKGNLRRHLKTCCPAVSKET